MVAPVLSRRSALTLGLGASAAIATLPATGVGRAHAAGAPRDYTSRGVFDSYDEFFHAGDINGQPDQENANETGGYAWAQSYVLDGFAAMYRAYGDPVYLDRMVTNIDLILERTDAARGVTDYRGESLPAWRAMGPYTVGSAPLLDDAGDVAFEYRTSRGPADVTSVEVRHEADGLFALVVRNSARGTTDEFTGLSADPASARYAVAVVYDAFGTAANNSTLHDLGTGARPAAGVYAATALPAIFAVHTGMVTAPIAAFVGIVRGEGRLQRRYGGRVARYLRAVEAAVAVHDHEWVDLGAGRGTYRWPKGMTVPYDGNDQPVNQSLGLGRTLCELAHLTRRRRYADRVRALAKLLRSEIWTEDGAAQWHYWPSTASIFSGYAATGDPASDVSLHNPSYGTPGNGADQIEDTSHGAISVQFAAAAHRYRLGIGEADLRALARTFTHKLATTGADGLATVFTRVNGTGVAPSGQYLQAPRWIDAAEWDPAVFEHALAIYSDHQPEPGLGSGLASIGNLNWFAATH
ncbi:hypothetical protein Bcav_0636 [Beutenbergia cavernae DSM 12333]|uniref:Uncharacterized protein n=1 Tax=Beutenbergia cavernae (strain ATCC BAA-8 / DSM 12333 / CCUG 43141 / JCM 11478 / NBRC 16432 / NCIMB 13614 / HKI 0122) TaxID=471853 RepID=C5BY04_BEUC1|nr:hypothetical protein [Beutenbergia cavernae]ACQ78898.1 hypothetical protein Bcav_0636 [Beutenbergia cavernae DSM 12333]